MHEKLSGSYYTPLETVNFMCKYLQKYASNIDNILEPSAGDGRFLLPLLNLKKVKSVIGVELYKEKTDTIIKNIISDKLSVINSDFLDYANCTSNRFSAIIGNPPYINIKNMSKDFIEKSKLLCKELKLPESLIKNSWVTFLLASIKIIDENGGIFFVLPKEFLQVKYAEKLRIYLETRFNTIHIICFNQKMFPDIEQETCLVYLTNEVKALPYIAYKQYDKLDSTNVNFESRIERNKPLKKWSNAILSDSQIDLLNICSERIDNITNFASCAPGIVTGANNYFILNKDEVSKYNANEFVKPIISKSAMIKNSIEVNKKIIKRLADNNQKIYLLDLAEIPEDRLPYKLKEYLNEVANVERNGKRIEDSYKCSIRKPWYGVPVVKSGKVIFFKRYDECPRFCYNPNDIFTTDISYNLQLKDNIDAMSLVFCFYNSLTLAQCEFVGRYYGGGVSELTPNEFREISLPYKIIDKKNIEELKKKFINNESIDSIVDYVNEIVLKDFLGDKEIESLKDIRKKLMERRK